MFFANSCSSTKAFAPSNPSSSASEIRITISFLGCLFLAKKARIPSRIVTTPDPASLAPKEECGLES